MRPPPPIVKFVSNRPVQEPSPSVALMNMLLCAVVLQLSGYRHKTSSPLISRVRPDMALILSARETHETPFGTFTVLQDRSFNAL
jgi:hypothetical protein